MGRGSPICERDLWKRKKRCRVLWAKAHFKRTISKWKSDLWSDESKFDILVGNNGCRVLRAKEGDLPVCYQCSVQKPASLMVWRCRRAHGMCSLRVLEGTMNTEMYIKVLEQHMLLSRRCLFQQDNAKPHTAAITTACLFSGWKHISDKNGTKFKHQSSRNSYPRCPDVFKLFWKEEEMLHHGKHAPVPTILRPNLLWAHFFNKIVTFKKKNIDVVCLLLFINM